MVLAGCRAVGLLGWKVVGGLVEGWWRVGGGLVEGWWRVGGGLAGFLAGWRVVRGLLEGWWKVFAAGLFVLKIK
jgi:hypothetical protein